MVSSLTLVLVTVCVYFMWMDVALYINVQQVKPQQVGEAKPKDRTTNSSDYTYSPFSPMTQKLLFQVNEPFGAWNALVQLSF